MVDLINQFNFAMNYFGILVEHSADKLMRLLTALQTTVSRFIKHINVTDVTTNIKGLQIYKGRNIYVWKFV